MSNEPFERRDDGSRIYRLKDGTVVPGVTTVLNNLGWKTRVLMNWAWKQGKAGKDYRKVRGEAAAIGTMAHAMAEHDIKGLTLPVFPEAPPEAQASAELAYRAFKSWQSMSGLTIMESEVELVSEAYRFGGTIDAIAKDKDGRLALMDFKTGDLYREYLVQVAAYSELWNENYRDKLLTAGYHILVWGKELGDFHHHWFPRLDPAWDVFRHARAIHDLGYTLSKLA